jgi:ABC-type branched-subunit amino acid transport system permease subunit
MTTIWQRLSGSKIWGWVGAGLAALAGVCLAMKDTVIEAWPTGGARACAVLVVVGAVIAWLAKSPATRRTGEELTLVRLPGGEVIPNRRNPPPGD